MMIRLWQVKRWLSRLLVRLGIRKQGVMVPGAFTKLFKPGLQKEFESAYQAKQIIVGFDPAAQPNRSGFMCGNCSLMSTDINEIIDHKCPGPSPKPEYDEPNFCPECGRDYEEE